MLLLAYESSLYILDTSPLSDFYFCKHFLPFCALSFHFLSGIFQRADVFNLTKSNSSNFYPVNHPRNLCLYQGHKAFLLCFLRTFYSFRSMIHFEFIFVYSESCGLRFICFFIWMSNYSNTFYRIDRMCGSISGFYPVPLVYVSILLSVLHCLNYCSFIISLGLR